MSEFQKFKDAIKNKQIDIEKYEHRFDNDYNSDKRLLKSNITLDRLKELANKLDIEVTLSFENERIEVLR